MRHTALWLAGILMTAAAIAGEPAKLISVDLENQKLFAWEGEDLVHEFHAVTGKCGKETEPGTYKVEWKSEDYVSKTYGSPMPYAMFFSADGKAIHGTEWATVRSFVHAYVSGEVGSQGCVGLAEENAKTMFEWAPVGTPIVVMENHPDEEGTSHSPLKADTE